MVLLSGSQVGDQKRSVFVEFGDNVKIAIGSGSKAVIFHSLFKQNGLMVNRGNHLFHIINEE